MVNYKNEAKRIAIVTALIALPVFLLAAYFSNVHAGPGIEFLFWVGVFLLLPVYLLREMGAFSGTFGAWVAIILTEPLWLFILAFGVRIAWLKLKQRYRTTRVEPKGSDSIESKPEPKGSDSIESKPRTDTLSITG